MYRTRTSAGLKFPLAFAVEIEELVVNVPAVADGSAVIHDACDAARAEPFDIPDISHANSGLDTVFKHLESYRPG